MLAVAGFSSTFHPSTAHAFGPQATVAVATQALGALPDAATAPWRGNLGIALGRRRAADEADPERAALASHFDERDLVTPVAGLAPADDPGDAILTFAAAVRAFAAAIALGDASGSADASARIAQAACDLADPFQTTPSERPEVPGGRARF